MVFWVFYDLTMQVIHCFFNYISLKNKAANHNKNNAKGITAIISLTGFDIDVKTTDLFIKIFRE